MLIMYLSWNISIWFYRVYKINYVYVYRFYNIFDDNKYFFFLKIISKLIKYLYCERNVFFCLLEVNLNMFEDICYILV